MGAFEGKFKAIEFFLNDKNRLKGNQPSPTPIYFPTLQDQNFEIVVLFNIVERSNDYLLRANMSPVVRGERPEIYEFCPLFTYREVLRYWEVYIHFSKGGFSAWGEF